MLVLTRNLNETIMIGDDIQIQVVDIKPNKIKLGITAPKGVPVHRREVWEAIKGQSSSPKTTRCLHSRSIVRDDSLVCQLCGAIGTRGKKRIEWKSASVAQPAEQAETASG